MYKQNPNLLPLPDHDVKIWRYLSLAKFMAMLKDSALYFSRADQLGDPFEGTNTHPTRSLLQEIYGKGGRLTDVEMAKLVLLVQRGLRRTHYVNCWTRSEHESAAMWELYVPGKEGVAIQSTVGRLIECFHPNDPTEVFVGEVEYLDYHRDVTNVEESLVWFFSKRNLYKDDHEIRCVVRDPLRLEDSTADEDGNPGGRSVRVDLPKLVENVLISPFTGPWFEQIVEDRLKQSPLPLHARWSMLAEKPEL